MMSMIRGEGTNLELKEVNTVELENLEEEKREGILEEKNGVIGIHIYFKCVIYCDQHHID